jgi:hypothetical protein
VPASETTHVAAKARQRARARLCLVFGFLLVACGEADTGTKETPDGSLTETLPDGNIVEVGTKTGDTGGGGAKSDTGGSGGAGDTGTGTSGAEAGGEIDSGEDGASGPPGSPCGYKNEGVTTQIAPGIEICLPPVVCTQSETCPRGLGNCVAGKCVFNAGYEGLATLPQAWATEYCDLTMDGCNGAVLNPLPSDVAAAVATMYGDPVCADSPDATGTCVGIAAPPPMMAGNSQVAIDPSTGKEVALWGLGMTAASGLCYQVTGAGGTAVVAITDRCGGYCECGSGSYNECGDCINATDTTTECPCVGTAPPLYTTCCGRTCAGGGTTTCDWCANNNHPHFDMDNATFAHVCGPAGPMYGSCQLTQVQIIPNCYPASPTWPN